MNQNEETDNDTKDVHQQRNDRSNSPTTSNQKNRNIHKIRRHVCKTCNKGFQYKTDLSRHDRIHKNEKPFKCDICGHMSRTNGDLTSHMVAIHKNDDRFISNKDLYTGGVSYTCRTCKKEFKNKNCLRIHDRIHKNEKPFKCDICGHMSRTKGNLSSHIRGIHFKSNTGGKSYKCRTCNKEFEIKWNCNMHERTHTGVKDYECKLCEYKCLSKGSLESHILAMHLDDERFMSNRHLYTVGKSYKCGMCHKEFKNKAKFAIHERIHTGEKLYTCKLCEYKCSHKGNLTRHVKSKHRNDERLKSNKDIYNGGVSYKCRTCHKEFKNKTKFDIHERIHTGEKPYTCKLCEYKCSQKGHLTSHVKRKHRNDERLKSNKDVYTGGVSYKCGTCNNEFKSKAHLHIHERTHIGEKPYHCVFCGDMFRHIRSLKQHKFVFH